MSTKTAIVKFLESRYAEWSDERRETMAEKLKSVVTDVSSPGIWRHVSFELFGSYPDGSTTATEADIERVYSTRLAELEATLGRKATGDEALNFAFQTSEEARARGYTPPTKLSMADKLDNVSIADLAARFDMVGDAATFRDMPASKRIEYQQIIAAERDAALNVREPSKNDETLSPAERLNRYWA